MSILHLFRDSIKAYLNDRAAIYAAGLAYYAVFAIAPLLILTAAIAGVFIGESLASSQISESIEYFVGPELASYLSEIASAVARQTVSTGVTLLSVIGLFLSGAGIFNQLDRALNDIWGLEKLRPDSLRDRLVLLRHNIGPFAVVFFLGLLLSASVLINTAVGTLYSRLSDLFPMVAQYQPQTSLLVIPGLTFLLLCAIYKWLPDARSRWQDVAVGAFVTTIIFLIGRWGLTLYLQLNDRGSLFGAASSIIILLIWVDVSAHIVLYGAEFTKLYADRFGQPIRPRRMTAFVESTTVKPPASEEK